MNTSLEAKSTRLEEDMKGAEKANKDEPKLTNRKPTYYQTFALKMKNKQRENLSNTAKVSSNKKQREQVTGSDGIAPGLLETTKEVHSEKEDKMEEAKPTGQMTTTNVDEKVAKHSNIEGFFEFSERGQFLGIIPL